MERPTEENFAELVSRFLGKRPEEHVLRCLWGHYELLDRWNRSLNLTSVREFEEIVKRHYAESLFAAPFVPRGTLADIGSGAGFPGLPIAAARSDVRVTLVESVHKKATFLRETSDLLPNVGVLNCRAETITTSFDAITARAVLPRDVLSLIPRVAPAFILLIGEDDAPAILESSKYHCEPLVHIPWSERTVLLRGHAVLA